jgi:hypothetical protein
VAVGVGGAGVGVLVGVAVGTADGNSVLVDAAAVVLEAIGRPGPGGTVLVTIGIMVRTGARVLVSVQPTDAMKKSSTAASASQPLRGMRPPPLLARILASAR